ncbi:serine/threonine protein kinase [Massilia sp. IC2-476]|uniref:protein kinase domain-containing protein n=1 Tax=Massilia sp. IC2-476 TaxID=2887199 RepID=UPI001D108A6D|nr:serine/threonine protein kinase [Massilia sp. IC2-476]MCC2972590.1 serine/threonine protein kinase [Massilia sp. IC2-476]
MVQQGTIITLARGQYRLREALGGSAYGLVWRAESAGGSVAIKLVNTDQMALAPSLLQRHWIDSAHAEEAFLSSLAPWDARHIVRLLDSGEHDGLPAMALELLDGDLAAHVKTTGTPGSLQALDWTAQVNQALAKVHAAGFRYLDLKPANLLLDRRSGSLKLADFGTSRPLLDAPTHSYAGTARWQAPEQFFPQARGLYVTDPRSDYFALGALLYWLVCGRPLRYGAACAHAYAAHGSEGAAILRREQGGIPPTLQPDEAATFASAFGTAGQEASALLRALLAPEPAARPAHALAISRLLDAVRVAMAAPLRRAA